MPYKYNQLNRSHFNKPKFRQKNWSQYNQALKNRGSIDIWLSKEILDKWQFSERLYDGTGSTVKYPDETIEACHHLRIVFKQPLRQAQGFIDSWLNRYRRLLVRWEKKIENYEAMLHFACGFIVWNKSLLG